MGSSEETLAYLRGLNKPARAARKRFTRNLNYALVGVAGLTAAAALYTIDRHSSAPYIADSQAADLSHRLDEECNVTTWRVRSIDLDEPMRGQGQVEVTRMTDGQEACYDRVVAALPLEIDGCSLAYHHSGWRNPDSQSERLNVVVDCATRYDVHADLSEK